VKFKEAWRISKTVTVESVFKGTIQMRGGLASISAQRDPAKAIKSLKTSIRFSKIVPTFVFGLYSAMIPLMVLFEEHSFDLLFATNSIFFVLALVFLLSFNLLYMTSFVSGESLTPLAALPFSREDLSKISVLSFIRLFDIPLAVFIVTYPIVYGFVTGSVIGALLVFLFNLYTAVTAVFVTFFLARGFNTRILSLGGSKVKSTLRVVLFVLYGLGTFGALYFSGYLIQWIAQLIPFFTTLQSQEFSWVLFVFPFCFGYLAAVVSSSSSLSSILDSLLTPQSLMAVFASTAYIILGFVAYKRGMRALRQLALGELAIAPKITAPSGEIKLAVRGIFSSIFRKDIKLASRNMAYLGFLIMPVISVFMFAAITSSLGAIRVSGVLVATLYSSFFMVGFALMSLQFEGRGVSVLTQLPVSVRKVIQVKSLISAAFSAAMPATLLLLYFFEPFTTFYSLIIAAISVGTVYASSLIGTTLACSMLGEGKLATAAFQGHMGAYLFLIIVSGIFTIVPTLVYGAIYWFLVKDYLVCIAAMAAAMTIEVIVANLASKAALKG
jgi:predicted permease